MADWRPEWRALTAYSLLAAVRPTTFTGFTWRCTTAGTSGAVEPVWPDPSIAQTIVDGTVTWQIGTGFRQAVHAGIVATLEAYRAANPTLLRKVWAARPPSFTLGDLPCVYVDSLSEDITHSQGVRVRDFTGMTIAIVDRAPDAQEVVERMDFLIDTLLDVLSAAYHMAGGRTIVEPTGVVDGPGGSLSDAPQTSFYSNLVNFSANIQEGRT